MRVFIRNSPRECHSHGGDNCSSCLGLFEPNLISLHFDVNATFLRSNVVLESIFQRVNTGCLRYFFFEKKSKGCHSVGFAGIGCATSCLLWNPNDASCPKAVMAPKGSGR